MPTVDELIQAMRLRTLHQIRADLEKLRLKKPAEYEVIAKFYMPTGK